LAAFILQITIAPSIAIAEVVAEFTFCCSLMLAFRLSQSNATLTAFLLGYLVDLTCGTPLGVRALTYCIAAFILARFANTKALENLSARYLAMILLLFAGGVLVAIFMSIVGYDNNLGYSLINRALPGGLYNSVICLLFLPLVHSSSSIIKSGSKPLKESLPPL
jgi:rod shape-determining protein MreD